MSENLEYKIVKENVLPFYMANVTCMINDSKIFEIDELSHIVLKRTNIRMGYIRDNTLELVNHNNNSIKEYHSKLKNIFNYELLN